MQKFVYEYATKVFLERELLKNTWRRKFPDTEKMSCLPMAVVQ